MIIKWQFLYRHFQENSKYTIYHQVIFYYCVFALHKPPAYKRFTSGAKRKHIDI